MNLKLFNTFSRKKEIFKPLKDKKVGLYTCGPTVYNYAHIGNLRTYIFEDLLKRILVANGYKVKHVMNITDVGHLTSEADSGEDKMEKGSKREKKTVWEIAEFYTQEFKKNLTDLNILPPDFWPKATDYIQEQIALIKKLEKTGYTYLLSDGVYFNTEKLKNYGQLAKLNKKGLRAGARISLGNKKNTTDFALWKISPKDKKRQMEWDSPWGKGFPGWHTECVVMAIKHLGQPFDIHCGAIDLIPIHHTNEIAQAEAAYQKKLARYWLHGEFLLINQNKMGKSEENFIILENLKEKNFNPLVYRYLCLTAHYRSKLNFTWDSLAAAQNALHKIYETISSYQQEGKFGCAEMEKKFLRSINDDLNLPLALSLAWKLINSKLPSEAKLTTLFKFDRVFGLKLKEIWQEAKKIPAELKFLLEQRERAREEKKWLEADQLREKIKELGYLIEDTEGGQNIKKIFQ